MMGERFYFEEKSEWAEEVEIIYHSHINSLWRVADLLVMGIERFTDGSPEQVAELYQEMAEQLERKPKTLENYVTVARRFPENKRYYPHLGRGPWHLGHHALVTKFSDEVAKAWLEKAWSEGWSEGQMRMQLRLAADQADPDSSIPLTEPVAIERQFWRMGVKAKLLTKEVRFETPAGTLVVSSESRLNWSLLQD